MKFGTLNLLLLTLLVGCGGGSSTSVPVVITQQDITTTIKGTACNTNVDALGSINFLSAHSVNERSYGCLIVDRSDGFPVLDGSKSARFEVRPWDCSSNGTFDDCYNDRSRHEIIDSSVWNNSTNGQIITYTTSLYIPKQENFRPKGTSKYNPILFLGQIISLGGPSGFSTLAFLEVNENTELVLRPQILPQSATVEQVPLTANIFDRWINVRYEIKSSHTAGYIKVYVDNELRFEREQPTLLDANGSTGIKLGIYNAFKSGAVQTYSTQIIYYDNLHKSIQ